MDTATQTQTRTLEIDGMSGDACVKKVTGALKTVDGVETKSVSVGSATIKSDKAGCDAACACIRAAGFPAHEGVRTGRDTNEHTGNSGAMPSAKGQKPSNQHQDDTDDAASGKTGGQKQGQVITPGSAPKPVMK